VRAAEPRAGAGPDAGAYLFGAFNTGGSTAATPTSFDVVAPEGTVSAASGREDTLSLFDAGLDAATAEFLGADVADAALSEAHCLLVKNGGKLLAFGYNAYGQATGKLTHDVVERPPRGVDCGAVHVAGATDVLRVAANGGTSALLLRPRMLV